METSLLEGPARDWLSRHRTAVVSLCWLMLRPLQFYLTAPSPDVRRYFELSNAWWRGLVPYAQFQMEYPPGALPLFALPQLFSASWGTYVSLFALGMLLVDLASVVLLLRLPALWAPPGAEAVADAAGLQRDRRAQGALIACLYMGLTMALAQLPLERFDAVCTLLLLLWFTQTLRGRLWAADLCLALSIWIKLIGVILVPLYLAFVLVCQRGPGAPPQPWRTYGRQIGRRLIGIGGLSTLLFLPTLIQAGSAITGFLTYHTQRGLQFESLPASILLGLHRLGLIQAGTIYARQSMCTEVVHPWTGAIVAAIPDCSLLALTGVSLVFGRRLWRSVDLATAQATFLDGTLAVLLAFMLVNKVFSPQYLLWLGPFMVLLLLRTDRTARSALLGLSVAWCITALFQRFYYMNLLYIEPLPVALLLTRNLLLLATLLQLLGLPPLPERLLPWLRQPAWGALATGLAAFWAFLANLSETTANDIWIQMRVGYDILRTQAFPSLETYSATVAGRPFIAHEWLSSVVFALLDRVCGGAGLSFLTAGVALACFGLLWASGTAQQRQSLYFGPLLLLAIYLTSFRVLARPHIFSLVAFACIVLALERWRRSGRSRDLLWLLPMQLLWVNLHGAALFGPALFAMLAGLVAVLTLLPALAGSADAERYNARSVLQLGGMALALAATCMLNPYGTELITFSIDLLGNAYVKSRVWEWTSPIRASNGHYYWMWLYVAMLALLWLGLLSRLATRPWIDLSLAALMTLLSLRANRFVSDAALFMFPILARSLQGLGIWTAGAQRLRRQPWLELGLVTLLLTNTLVHGYAHSMREHRPLFGWGYGGDMPYMEVDLLKKMNLRGTIFNEYSDGALIIYHLAPQIRPVLDSRIDLYPLDTVLAYDQAYMSAAAFENYMQRYRINLVMLVRARMPPGMVQYFTGRPDWQPLTISPDRVLYVRRSTVPAAPKHRPQDAFTGRLQPGAP